MNVPSYIFFTPLMMVLPCLATVWSVLRKVLWDKKIGSFGSVCIALAGIYYCAIGYAVTVVNGPFNRVFVWWFPLIGGLLALAIILDWYIQDHRWIGNQRCLKCGYSLRGLSSRRCPECGEEVVVVESYEVERDPDSSVEGPASERSGLPPSGFGQWGKV